MAKLSIQWLIEPLKVRIDVVSHKLVIKKTYHMYMDIEKIFHKFKPKV